MVIISYATGILWIFMAVTFPIKFQMKVCYNIYLILDSNETA